MTQIEPTEQQLELMHALQYNHWMSVFVRARNHVFIRGDMPARARELLGGTGFSVKRVIGGDVFTWAEAQRIFEALEADRTLRMVGQ